MRPPRPNIHEYRAFGRNSGRFTIYRRSMSGWVFHSSSGSCFGLSSLLLTGITNGLQEDAVITDTSDDAENAKDLYCPFELPDDEFGEMMWDRRFAKEGSSSPPGSLRAESRRGSTVPDTDGMFAYICVIF